MQEHTAALEQAKADHANHVGDAQFYANLSQGFAAHADYQITKLKHAARDAAEALRAG